MTTSESSDGYDLEPDQAVKDLDAANRIAGRARAQGWRWVRTYLLVWALASIGLVIGLGIGNPAVFIGIFIAWGLLALAGGIWSRSRGAVAPRRRPPHRSGRRTVGGVLRNRSGRRWEPGFRVDRFLDSRGHVHGCTVGGGRAHPRPTGR